MKRHALAVIVCAVFIGVSCSGPTVPDATPKDTTYLLPKILSFTVTPAEIQSGDIVYLSFALELPYSPTPTIASISRDYANNVIWSMTPAPPGVGNLHDYPASTATYTLTVTNNEGTATASRTVIVK